jgi:acyl carrier protein
MSRVVRTILQRHGRLAVPIETLEDRAQLRDAGMDSMAMVNVMLAIEQALGIEFPEALMTRKSFASIQAIDALIQQVAPDFEQLDARV